jgi:hypothetical protein
VHILLLTSLDLERCTLFFYIVCASLFVVVPLPVSVSDHLFTLVFNAWQLQLEGYQKLPYSGIGMVPPGQIRFDQAIQLA